MNSEFGSARTVQALGICGSLLMALSTGCGTGVYAERFDARLVELQRESAFAPLNRLTEDMPVNFRLPDTLTHAFTLHSADTVDASKHVSRARVLPPFLLNGVGFRESFEGTYLDISQVKTPYYLYIWMHDAPRPKDGLEIVRNTLAAILGPPESDWTDVAAKTPDGPEGQTRNWKRIHFKAPQSFEVERNSNLADEVMPGIFELWVYDAKGCDVVLGWRASEDAWDKCKIGDAKLQDIPELVAGTIQPPTTGERNKKPVPANGIGLFAPGPDGRAPTAKGSPGNGAGDTTTPPAKSRSGR
ncbi:MAG TPA: hypothetical protein VGY55_22965 [Pirellulales bacterium]|nr:hypothetical protein [Pirellulales bacterium]